MKVKSLDLLMIEKAFGDIKAKTNVEGSIAKIEQILSRAFDLNVELFLTKNETNEFFGMSVFPDRSTTDAIVDYMLNQRSKSGVIEELWADTKHWHIEIDELLMYDPNLNANPAEITAVLLHEMAHVIYSNEVPRRVNRIVRFEVMNASFALKKVLKWNKAQALFKLAFLESCTSKSFRYVAAQKNEMEADYFVVTQGYGDELNSFIDKLLTTQGNDLIDRSEKEIEKDVKSIVGWTLINISELEFRKKNLRFVLQTEILRNPSLIIREMVKDIKVIFFGENRDTYKGVVTEQYMLQEKERIVKEGFLGMFDKYGKLKKISQLDIDVLYVEKDRIENEDDKIYVLDLIYNKIDEIDTGLELIERKENSRVPVSKDTLKKYRQELEKLRKEVIEVPLKNEGYGIYIKYPKGYEG